MQKGKELIRSYLEDAPILPGVYRMLDCDKNILYIGKAKNLKNRLSQYTLELEGKNKRMVSEVTSVEYSVTPSESDALLLESKLIRKFKPKFNILLKDDKSFPYIKLRLDHNYPQLLKYRGKHTDDGKLFGPFASVSHVDVTLSELQKIFRLRNCSDSYFENRKRPCLQYQIKRCYGPCVDKISKEEYSELVIEVKEFLSGKNKKLQASLALKMEKESASMNFEKAAEIRDRIKALSYIQLKSDIASDLEDADVIALAKHNGEFCIQLFIYRAHQPCGNIAYFPNHTYDTSEEEVMGAFIMQLYQNREYPKQILLSHEITDLHNYEVALKNLHGKSLKIYMPKLGAKYQIIQNALQNAKLALDKYLKISAKNISALKSIQELFNLDEIPKRIEVYDNSHIQGAFPVGAMVVAGVDGFEKKEYRLFNLKNDDVSNSYGIGGDDYAMLREVLTRRIKRLKSESYRKPDLMIIDGGKGHMKTVLDVMENLKVDLPFVCMSKGVDRNSGRENFHCKNQEVFTLDKNLDVMKYLQVLRDEVHNFAITSHRNKRSKAIRASSLDDISGIGVARKKALLNYFGSFKEISNATILELAKVDNISKELAKSIYDILHP